MLEDNFLSVYMKFKLQFYKAVFSKVGERETTLSTIETFCMECIKALDNPTINEFASFIGVSAPNATYKVTSLIQKGYLKKVQSLNDKREFYLSPTDKYYSYYNISGHYINKVMQRMNERFTIDEIAKFSEMLEIVDKELMPELPTKLNLE